MTALLAAPKTDTTDRRTEGVQTIDPVGVGARIAHARKVAGLKQSDLAERIGVITRSVQNYERGRVPWKLLDPIAEALGVTKEWLLYGDEEVAAVALGEAAPSTTGLPAIDALDRIEEKIDRLLDAILGGRDA